MSTRDPLLRFVALSVRSGCPWADSNAPTVLSCCGLSRRRSSSRPCANLQRLPAWHEPGAGHVPCPPWHACLQIVAAHPRLAKVGLIAQLRGAVSEVARSTPAAGPLQVELAKPGLLVDVQPSAYRNEARRRFPNTLSTPSGGDLRGLVPT